MAAAKAEPREPRDRSGKAAAPSGAEAEEVDEATRAREDEILKRAVRARAAAKATVIGNAPAPPEPRHGRAHWDYVLREMQWMANDFMQERRWKFGAAARVAAAAARRAGERAGPAPEKPEGKGKAKKPRGRAARGEAKEDRGKGPRDRGVDDGREATAGPRTPDRAGAAGADPGPHHYALPEAGGVPALFARLEEEEEGRVRAEREKGYGYERQLEEYRKAAAEAAQEAKEEAERMKLLRAREERMAMAAAAANAAAHRAEEGALTKGKRKKNKKGGQLPGHLSENAFLGGDMLMLDANGSPLKKQKLGKAGVSLLDGKGKKGRKGEGLGAAGDKKSHKKKDGKDKKGKKGKKISLPTPGTEIPWTTAEDQLLCSIVHEFGTNWTLISDVLSSCLSLRGVFRRADQCKARFRLVTSSAAGKGPEAERELVIGGLKLNKQSARYVLQNCTPADEDTLKHHLEVLYQVGSKKKPADTPPEGAQVTAAHPSHLNTQRHAVGHGPLPGPLELCELALQVLPGGGPGALGQRLPGMGHMPGYVGPGDAAAAAVGAGHSMQGLPGRPAYPGMPAGPHAMGLPGAHPMGMQGGAPVQRQVSGGASISMSAAVQALNTGKHPVTGQPLSDGQKKSIYARIQAQRERMGAMQQQAAAAAQQQQQGYQPPGLPGNGVPGVPPRLPPQQAAPAPAAAPAAPPPEAAAKAAPPKAKGKAAAKKPPAKTPAKGKKKAG